MLYYSYSPLFKKQHTSPCSAPEITSFNNLEFQSSNILFLKISIFPQFSFQSFEFFIDQFQLI